MTDHLASLTHEVTSLPWHTPKIVIRQWNLHGHFHFAILSGNLSDLILVSLFGIAEESSH